MLKDEDAVQSYEKDLRESFVHKRPDPQGNPPTMRITSNSRNDSNVSEGDQNNSGNRSGNSASSNPKK